MCLLLFLCDPAGIKIVQPKVGQLGILNMSFIYDKTSPSKGGMIGTMYHNSHHSALITF